MVVETVLAGRARGTQRRGVLPFRTPFGRIVAALGLAAAASGGVRGTAEPAATVIWRLDQVSRVGGHATEILGAPRVVGGAVGFDGVKDGLFVSALPLAGAAQFTLEILFKPEEGGPAEQRFLHLQDTNEWRVMIETRLDGRGGWWLDTYLGSPKGGTPLIDPQRVHPTNRWYWAAVRYDGETMTHYVNGGKEREATPVKFGPLGAGRISLGVRQNKVYWFKGAIREVRFTPVALAAEALQRTP